VGVKLAKQEYYHSHSHRHTNKLKSIYVYINQTSRLLVVNRIEQYLQSELETAVSVATMECTKYYFFIFHLSKERKDIVGVVIIIHV